MNESDITCPKCRHKFKIGQDVIARSVRDNIENEVKKKMTVDFDNRLKEEKETLEKNLTENQNKEILFLKNSLEEKAQKIDDFQERELKLMKQTNELETQKKEIELTTQRRLNEERKKIEEDSVKIAEEKFQFKILEKEKQLEDQKKLIAEMQRKAQQGSMQTQGEVVELTLEDILKKQFPHDQIEPVGKGINGADIIQKIITTGGDEVGTIAWEIKQTKAWTEEWVTKLKDDGRNIKANALVLVSAVLPKDIKSFGLYKGIWVTNFDSAVGLAMVIRQQSMSLAQFTSSQQNKEEKKDILYNYLTSQTFAGKIETIVENFVNMKSSLEKEKIAMTRIWTVRESQLTRLTETTVKMYGEIQGIAGAKQLPNLEIMELENIAQIEEPKTRASKTVDEAQANLF